MASHSADLSGHIKLSDPLKEQCDLTRLNTPFSEQNMFSILWCWPDRWPINSRLFYALSNLCSLNKTLNWAIKKVVTCDFPKKGEIR